MHFIIIQLASYSYIPLPKKKYKKTHIMHTLFYCENNIYYNVVSCCRIACGSRPHTHLISNTVNTGVRMDFPSVDTKSRDHFCLHTAAAQCNCKAFHTVTVEC